MTIKQTIIQCSKLAESNCANFINGKCQGEKSCPVFICTLNNGLRCPYFEESVLPVNSELQDAYAVHVLGEGASYSSKKCKGCGKVFKTNNYRIQYCSDLCRKSARNYTHIKHNHKRRF